MSTFDPEPGKPYGLCNTCGVTLDTEEAANQHMRGTFDESGDLKKSHSTTATNPSRSQRVEREVRFRVDDAISDAMDELDRLVQREEATDEEISEALRWYPDFADAWTEFVAEGER